MTALHDGVLEVASRDGARQIAIATGSTAFMTNALTAASS